MYTAKIENSFGEILTLTQDETDYQVLKVMGLNPAPAQVNMTNIAGLDGARFNSSKLETRNIVITLRLNGEVEDNRQRLYQFFRTKDFCTFYFRNKNRDVFILGYVETVEVDLFSAGEIMQISIICPYPYFKSIGAVTFDISDRVAGFEFPFSINADAPEPFSMLIENRITDVFNDSETETGVEIIIDVLRMCSQIEIVNTDTSGTMKIAGAYSRGDRIVINTNRGEKSIYLYNGTTKTNIFSNMVKGSEFFQLKPGSNHFRYHVDGNFFEEDLNVAIFFSFNRVYRGV